MFFQKIGQKFPKSHRILKRTDFLKIQSSQNRFITEHLVFCYTKTETEFSRLGITVTKKHGKACTRNHIKRHIREAFRLNYRLFNSHPVDVVIIPKKNIINASFNDLNHEVIFFASKAKIKR